MKKLLEKFVKPIKTKENSYRLNKNDLPECGGNFQSEESPKLDVYKNFEFDSDCNDNAVLVDSPTRNKSRVNSLLSLNLSDSKSDVMSGANNRRHSEMCGLDLDWISLGCKNESSIDDVFFGKEEKVKKLEPKEVQSSGSNTYVININNSKNFYVGSLKTINVGDPAKDSTELKGPKDWSVEGNDEDFDELLDSEKKLTEDNITRISMYLDCRWKDFGKTLGFDELFLKELEERNDGNCSIIVYDLLRKYLGEFPNTTLGFVVYVLKKIQSTNVIDKLAENKRF